MVMLRLQELLDERSKDIAWLARETGMSYQGIFSLVKGKRKGLTLATIDALCGVLECEPGVLFVRTNGSSGKPKRRQR